MNQPITVDRKDVDRYIGIRGVTAERMAGAVHFVEDNTPEVIAIRLAEMGAENDRHRARIGLINIVSTNERWIEEADIPSVEWAMGRKLEATP